MIGKHFAVCFWALMLNKPPFSREDVTDIGPTSAGNWHFWQTASIWCQLIQQWSKMEIRIQQWARYCVKTQINKPNIKCSWFLKENVFERKHAVKIAFRVYFAYLFCTDLYWIIVEITITSDANSLTSTENIYRSPTVHISPSKKQMFIVSSLLNSN